MNKFFVLDYILWFFFQQTLIEFFSNKDYMTVLIFNFFFVEIGYCWRIYKFSLDWLLKWFMVKIYRKLMAFYRFYVIISKPFLILVNFYIYQEPFGIFFSFKINHLFAVKNSVEIPPPDSNFLDSLVVRIGNKSLNWSRKRIENRPTFEGQEEVGSNTSYPLK